MHHGKAVLSPPHLAALRPFLDSEGLLRVGGRLSNADVDSDMKHPVILHGRSPLVHRLVESVHRSSLHAGPTTLLTLLAERYHIIGVRQLARSISRQCVVCQRTYLKTAEQLMVSCLPVASIQLHHFRRWVLILLDPLPPGEATRGSQLV